MYIIIKWRDYFDFESKVRNFLGNDLKNKLYFQRCITAQKMKFSVKYFFSICELIRIL